MCHILKNKIFFKTNLILILFVFLGIPLHADIVLPQDDFVKEWKKSEKLLIFSKNELFNYIDGGAELFLEFGFEKLYVQRYSSKNSELTLEVYEMESPESALGIYLTKCGQEVPIKGLGARHSAEKSQFTILRERYFIHVNNFSGNEALLAVMLALSQEMLKNLPADNAVRLLEYLPKENLIAHSERLIRGPYALQPIFTFGQGDILELSRKVFGVVGNYKDEKGRISTCIIIPYPDQEKAFSAYQNLHDNFDPYHKILETWPTGFSFIDYRQKFGMAKLKGSILEIHINLATQPSH